MASIIFLDDPHKQCKEEIARLNEIIEELKIIEIKDDADDIHARYKQQLAAKDAVIAELRNQIEGQRHHLSVPGPTQRPRSPSPGPSAAYCRCNFSKCDTSRCICVRMSRPCTELCNCRANCQNQQRNSRRLGFIE